MMPPVARRTLVIALCLALLAIDAPPAAAQPVGDCSEREAERDADRDQERAQADEGGDDGEDGDGERRRRRRRARQREPEPEPCVPAPPQVSLTGVASPPAAAVDLDLQAALDSIGFLETWYAGTPTHPRLSLVAVQGPAADAARSALLGRIDELIGVRETTTTLLNVTHQAVAQRRALERDVEIVDGRIRTLEGELGRTEDRIAQLRDDLAEVVAALRDAAVGLYVSDTTSGIGGIDDVAGYNDHQELAVQVDVTVEELLGQQAALEADIAEQQDRARALRDSIDAKREERAQLVGQVVALGETIDALTAEIGALTRRRVEIEVELPTTMDELHQARLLARAPSVDFTLVTLDAYVRAAEGVQRHYPGCALRWELLAGIAQVESGHATFGGASVRPDGQVDRQILGPLLDGTLPDTAIITDTEGGALDGNASFDAAVGPFQFLPGTWRLHGLDATGDGFADPHNLYDAGLSAAGYLCAVSSLGSDAAVRSSVLAYNHSLFYLADVTGRARSYIVALALPDAAYDPETVDAATGWTLQLGESDPYVALGQIGPRVKPVPAAQAVGDG